MLLTICNYNGMNATAGTPQFGLLGAAQIRRAGPIRRITEELDAIKATKRGAVFNCPMDDASQAVLSFYYGSADVIVDVGTKGCGNVTSGSIHRLALGAPVVAQVQKLATAVKLSWAAITGHVRLCGGPYPGRCWTQKEGWPYVSSVNAVNSSGFWVAMAQLHHNRFRFSIATPGHYRFELMGSGKQINTVIARASATVRVGATTNVVFTIPVP